MTETLERFRERVLDDSALQVRLRGLDSTEAFIARVLEVAAEAGFDLSPEEIETALRDARREWFERWI